MKKTAVYKWVKRFSEGRETVIDEEISGRPTTSRTEENIAKFHSIVRENQTTYIPTTRTHVPRLTCSGDSSHHTLSTLSHAGSLLSALQDLHDEISSSAKVHAFLLVSYS